MKSFTNHGGVAALTNSDAHYDLTKHYQSTKEHLHK